MDLEDKDTLIDVCKKILEMRMGDRKRIESIRKRAEEGKILYQLDKKYLERLSQYVKYEPEVQPRPQTQSPPEAQYRPQTQSPPEAQYRPQTQHTSQPNQVSSFCGACGTQIPVTNNFCTNCGAKKIITTPQASPQTRFQSSKSKSRKENLAEYEKEYTSRVNVGEFSSNEKTNAPPPSAHVDPARYPRQNPEASPQAPPPSVHVDPARYQRPPQWKNEGLAIILTAILGIFGCGGIGHLYLGKIGKGISILVVGIILFVVACVTLVGFLALIPFAIWVVYDVYKQCKYYNAHLEQHGRAPW